MRAMIELYTAGTPNGRKASIMLEEVGLPYTAHILDLGRGSRNRPRISPSTRTANTSDRGP
jgi:GST-like protein